MHGFQNVDLGKISSTSVTNCIHRLSLSFPTPRFSSRALTRRAQVATSRVDLNRPMSNNNSVNNCWCRGKRRSIITNISRVSSNEREPLVRVCSCQILQLSTGDPAATGSPLYSVSSVGLLQYWPNLMNCFLLSQHFEPEISLVVK